MDTVFKKFYRGFYLNSGGLIPTKPLNQQVYPGDFFQIKNGEMLVLGNIYNGSLISPENQQFENGIKLNAASWSFSEGISRPYSGRGSGTNPLEGDFEFSKQVLAFNEKGSYLFRGNDPELVKIANWAEIQQELIIKLTQTLYSFREVYIVTGCATTNDWTLAISDSDIGELEIANEAENYGLVDVFGHADSRTIQSKDIAYYNRAVGRKPSFFQAKRLTIENNVRASFLTDFMGKRALNEQWIRDFYDYEFVHSDNQYVPSSNHIQGCVLDMMSANQLTPNNALQYFKWDDISLDDVELLFSGYRS